MGLKAQALILCPETYKLPNFPLDQSLLLGMAGPTGASPSPGSLRLWDHPPNPEVAFPCAVLGLGRSHGVLQGHAPGLGTRPALSL